MSKTRRATHRKSISPSLFLAVLFVLLTAVGAGAVLVYGHRSRPVATEPGAPGRLVASQTTVDLGRVPFDKPAEARFDLANTGGATVRLIGPPRVRMLEGC
jgi:hypothetical protein